MKGDNEMANKILKIYPKLINNHRFVNQLHINCSTYPMVGKMLCLIKSVWAMLWGKILYIADTVSLKLVQLTY